MKPLVLFSSLAVLCAGGLLALSYEGWQDDPSALTSLSEETTRVKINPAIAVSNPPAAQPSTEAKAVTAKKAEEQVAAVDSKQTETKPDTTAAPAVKEEQPEAKPKLEEAEPQPKTDEADTQPKSDEADAKIASFDIVRVEEDGSAVLAGRAAPGDKVRILINEEVAGETQANDRGEWVVIPVSAMPAGAHQIQIETENADGKIKRAEQSVALTVPDKPGTQPLIVLSETAKPSIVLQKPATPEVKQAEVAQSTSETAAATGDTAENTEGATEEASSSTSEQPAPETKTAALEPPAEATAPTAVPTERKLAVDVVDYDEAGMTTFSGRSVPGSRVRVYVDNRFVGEAPAAGDGSWSFTAGSEISSGPHTLRTDEIAPSGKVNARIELPFFRESPERIASLQAQRKNATEEEDSAPSRPAAEAAGEPEVAAADAAKEPEPSAEPDKVAETEQTSTGETVAAVEPEDSATAVQEEKVAAPAPSEPQATQQTAGQKADAETVSPPAAVPSTDSTESQQVAAADAATEPAEAEAPQQPATQESTTRSDETAGTSTGAEASDQPVQAAETDAAAEADKPEVPQQTAEVEASGEPDKPEASNQPMAAEAETPAAKVEASQQTAAAETAAEPVKPESQAADAMETDGESAKPEVNQQVAAAEPVTQQDEPEQQALQATPSEPSATAEEVEEVAATSTPEDTETAPKTGRVVIQPGNNLWQISRVIYGRGRQYTVIYEANKSQIRDPDLIYPGQIFDTPGSDASESIDPSCYDPLAECQ